MSYTHNQHVLIKGKFRHLGGWRRDLPDYRDQIADVCLKILFTKPIPASASIPTYNIPIMDQEDVGSCTAHGSTWAYTHLAYKKNSKHLLYLSRLYNYYMTRTGYEHVDPSDDSGCQVRNAIKCLAQYGSCLEHLWPYDPDPSQRFSIRPNRGAIKDAHKHMAIKYSRVIGLQGVKQAIVAGYPVVGGFTCYNTIDDDSVAKDGIIPVPHTNDYPVGGHCVSFIGYSDQTQQVEFVNSWGDYWGKQGHGFLPYWYFEKKQATDFWIITEEM
jgi:C1A family cysteine protease